MRSPRADRGDNEAFWPLEKLVREADVLTFHTPLNKTGAYQSLHMADDELLAALPDGRILINACRGAVVDNAALLRALEKGKTQRGTGRLGARTGSLFTVVGPCRYWHTAYCRIYARRQSTGYHAGFEAFSQHLGQPQSVELVSLLPVPEFSHLRLNGELDEGKLKRLMHLVYDVRRDDAPLRHVAGLPGV